MKLADLSSLSCTVYKHHFKLYLFFFSGFVVNSQSSSPDQETIVQKIWEDYEKRVKVSRAIPRKLSMASTEYIPGVSVALVAG